MSFKFFYSLSPLLMALLLATTFCLESTAFKSGYIYEAIHKKMIQQVLEKAGLPKAHIKHVVDGADSQDDVTSSKFTDSPTHHFDDNLLKESIEYFEKRFAKAVKKSRTCYKDYGSAFQKKAIRDTLYTFGEGLHTVQDFYSHSNYVEMLSARGKKDSLVDWKALPAGIKTGYFYWNGYTDNESTRSWSTCVSKLTAQYKKKGKVLNFHSESEWKERKKDSSFESATKYVLDPKYDCLHYELNKDDVKQLEGGVKLPGGGTLHSRARALAILETKRQWKVFRKMLLKEYKARAQLIIPALKGYDVPLIKFTYTMPDKVEEGKPFAIRCNVGLEQSPVDKQQQRLYTGVYDLKVRASVYKDDKREARKLKELSRRKIGSDNTVVLELPGLTGAGERRIQLKAMFEGDTRYNAVRKTVMLTVGEPEAARSEVRKSGLLNSRWQVIADLGGSNGRRTYRVTVVEDNPPAFSVRVLGHRPGDTPAVFKGTRAGTRIKLHGWTKFKEKKVVDANGSLMKLSAGRVVETGRMKTSNFDIEARLSADGGRVEGMLVTSKKRFVGRRLN